MTITTDKNTVSMMELRNQPGTVLDRVFYRNESFVVEKAGEPRAAIIPVRAYNDWQRHKQEAKADLFKMIDKIQARTSKYDPKEVQAAIDEAVEAVKNQKQ